MSQTLSEFSGTIQHSDKMTDFRFGTGITPGNNEYLSIASNTDRLPLFFYKSGREVDFSFFRAFMTKNEEERLVQNHISVQLQGGFQRNG